MSEYATHAGTISAAFLCWIPLVTVVTGLVVSFFFTNLKAFSRDTYEGRREPTGGAYDPGYRGWRWK
jgi:hypothetical protein